MSVTSPVVSTIAASSGARITSWCRHMWAGFHSGGGGASFLVQASKMAALEDVRGFGRVRSGWGGAGFRKGIPE